MDSSSSHKIGYVIVIKNLLNPEGHQNLWFKVTAQQAYFILVPLSTEVKRFSVTSTQFILFLQFVHKKHYFVCTVLYWLVSMHLNTLINATCKISYA